MTRSGPRSSPLGASLPANDIHAISVSLPTWDNIVRYMAGDKAIHDKLESDYPRFYQHACVQTLNEAVLARLGFGVDDSKCLIFSSPDGARRCVQYFGEAVKGQPFWTRQAVFRLAVPTADENDKWARFWAVVFPASDASAEAATAFWGFMGDGISSRHAEFCFDRFLFMESFDAELEKSESRLRTHAPAASGNEAAPPAPWSSTQDGTAKESLRTMIAGLVTPSSGSESVHPEDVFLFSKGMCAMGEVARQLAPPYNSPASEAVIFGWPYGSTPKCVQASGYDRFTFLHRGAADELDALEASLASGERRIACLFCEIPSNPLCATPDLARVRALADRFGFVVVCDETIGTFVNVDPLPHVDVVVTSLTKMFSGACNVMGGSVVLNARSPHYARLRDALRQVHEDLVFPLDAATLLANSADFPARVHAANRNATAIASLLSRHPSVQQVNYPSLVASAPLYERYRRPGGGHGSLISFVFARPDSAVRFYDAVDLAKGPSFGTNFTLVLPYSQLAHAFELDWAESQGLAKHIIRISVGLEDEAVLVSKFEQALRQVEDFETPPRPSAATLDALCSLQQGIMKNKIEWGSAGAASSDFRSDVITRPSLRMLAAIVETTLGDDVFGEDRTTREFEAHVARIAGREDAMFVVTGTMANQLCLQALVTTRPSGIVFDADAHTLHYEAGGASLLSGGMAQPVAPSNGKYLRLQDLERHAVLPTDDVHRCPTGVVSMENTARGCVVPLDELRRIRDWARGHGIKTHLDGARLLEAVATGAGTLSDYCALVDLVSVDFSKNLGAPMGAMVVGDRRTIAAMRRTRKAIGGGMRQGGVLAAAAREALFENFGTGAEPERPMLRRVHALARRVAAEWTRRGGRLGRDVETNLVWLDLDAAGLEISPEILIDTAKRYGVALDGPRIVCHHQIDARAVQGLVRVFDELLGTDVGVNGIAYLEVLKGGGVAED
ncbi:pyridoxal phosphate-dependent transferase [Chaetomidium leptoderma]|uniref:Pyridoxal phosphate-dependent transferase n=1 Tax=Chaetomidium leptoderma TaxID=669021 RepID=A0AAN6VNU6_9PEZI|nr:pyridoxal phosphate-dependent transferase [Chaetomidium leptoderma]